jgi:hypothetical protein
MLRAIINFGEILNSAVGINILLKSDGSKDISWCHLSRHDDILVLEQCKSGIADFVHMDDRIADLIRRKVRLHINIIGRSVLTKKNIDPSENPAAFNSIFPGLQKDDFIHYQHAGTQVWFDSVIRKQDAVNQNLFFDYAAHSVSLGYTILDSIQPFLKQETVCANGHRISFSGNHVTDIETVSGEESEFDLAGQSIPANCLLAYASAVSLFAPPTGTITGLPKGVGVAAGIFRSQRQIFLVSRILLPIILISLLVNAMAFYWLSNRVSEMKAELAMSRGRSERIQQMNKRNISMSNAYDNIGWKLNRLPLFYTDQLAASVPAHVRLTVIETGTKNETVLRKDKKLTFNANQIWVQGVSSDPVILSTWIKSLYQYSWISEIKGQKYQFDSNLQKGVFDFFIEIR